MTAVLDELVQQLSLERIEENVFRGQSQDLGWGTVFGGQVLGQALSAAVQTVPPERHVHSMHAYFLRPGDVSRPIVYNVRRIRDGGSFTTRTVVAIQKGAPIFSMEASFQIQESGFEHQAKMPSAPPPDTLPHEDDRWAVLMPNIRAPLRERVTGPKPFEFRIDEPIADAFAPEKREPRRRIWMRAQGKLPDDPALHAYLLAYASDHAFMTTALLPHGVTFVSPGMQVASIDHAMWFHRPFRVDDWLLYDIDSPSAHGALGFARGQVFTKDGTHVVSTAQEGLIRQRK